MRFVVGIEEFVVKISLRLICAQIVSLNHLKGLWVLEHETVSTTARVCDDDFPRLSHVILVDR